MHCMGFEKFFECIVPPEMMPFKRGKAEIVIDLRRKIRYT